MKAKVITLSMSGDTPIVPGATDVSLEGPDMVIAYGDFVPTGKGRGMMRGPDQVYAVLEKLYDPGQYLVFAEDNVLAVLDPLGTSEKLSDLGTDCLTWRVTGTISEGPSPIPIPITDYVIEFAPGQVPAAAPTAQKPWVIGNITATSAKPSVKSTFGFVDMPAIIDGTKAVELKEE